MHSQGLSRASLLVLYILFSAPLVRSVYRWPNPRDFCVYSCYDWTDSILWNITVSDVDSDDAYYYSLCTSDLKILSIYYCAQTYCTPDEIDSGIGLLHLTCEEEVGISLPLPKTVALSDSQLADIPLIGQDDDAATETVYVPSIPDADWMQSYRRTITSFYSNIVYAYDFSYASYGFWGLVLVISAINRLVEMFRNSRRRSRAQRTPSRGLKTWIRRQLILPATFGKHCQEPIGWATLPPRIESLIISAYILMLVIMCFPGYDLFADNQFYETSGLQITRYIADRTGIIAIANVPVIWIFAARNDPLLWLTGFSFATFNRFHRWVARISVLFAVIHSIGYTVNYFLYEGDTYTEAWTEEYWYTGVIATCSMSLLLGASVWWLRQKHYDFFLIAHIVLAIIFLVTIWYHVKIWDGLFDVFVWAAVTVWSLDRLLRVARVVYLSAYPRFAKGVKAIATYDTRSEMVRLDATDFFKRNAIVPGQFYYVYTPGHLKGYESHPFTLCSWRRSLPASPVPSSSTQSSLDLEKYPQFHTEPVREHSLSDEVSHTFLIRPYAGFTRRLRDKINASHEERGSSQVTVFLEGPYGPRVDLKNYSDVLVIAGGSGVVAAISHTYHLLANGRTEVYLNWAVPQRHLVDDLCANELAAVANHPRFHMTVYLTSEAQDDTATSTATPYDVRSGRPDIFAVMSEARTRCKIDLGIVTSGTPQVADVCRASIVRLLKEEGPEVGYYDETTLW